MGRGQVKTIGVLTTSRADYGMYVPVLREIQRQGFILKLFVAGMHFDKRFGLTIRDIVKDGFPIAARINIRLVDSEKGIVEAMGKTTAAFGQVFFRCRPDLLLTLGDRYEMHAGALAAVPFGIPIAHLHGGELTYGVMDEYFRHSLTKLSSLHFSATQEYARRIIQMGEEPWRVKVTGSPALDGIVKVGPISVPDLRERLQINSGRPFLLVTFHPVTQEPENMETYIDRFLRVLAGYRSYHMVFTAPNADMGGDLIRRKIMAFVRNNASASYVANLGPSGYRSAMRYAAAMVGNSSSGIIEAASFRLPVVNVGTRQEGRIHPKNVIDVDYSARSICEGLDKALSGSFRRSLKHLKNPYGRGDASRRIVAALKKLDWNALKPKRFHTIHYGRPNA